MPEDQVDLIDLVFSWSLEDILNHDLLRDEVCLFFFFYHNCFMFLCFG